AMPSRPTFSADQTAMIRSALGGEVPPVCPSCSVPLDSRRIDPRPDVSYVRTRIWLSCSVCRRAVVLDAPDAGADPLRDR
ncbi:MAG: hypothetical protein OEZ37_08555, partial [Gemmatimonadota bacterium]|nr:hypothetical protein [Gemmatimonadota bacterium]